MWEGAKPGVWLPRGLGSPVLGFSAPTWGTGWGLGGMEQDMG